MRGEGGGNVRDRFGVGRDVFPDRSVAPGGSVDQGAVFVAQGEGKAVDFWLGGEGERRIGGEAQVTADTADEIRDIRIVEGIRK